MERRGKDEVKEGRAPSPEPRAAGRAGPAAGRQQVGRNSARASVTTVIGAFNFVLEVGL